MREVILISYKEYLELKKIEKKYNHLEERNGKGSDRPKNLKCKTCGK